MQITQVIKYEGDNSTFIWKHPREDFNTLTQLIVHESQEAIFFLNGQALDLFGPGRHTLETENIPLLKRVVSGMLGGDNPFHCEVYFINKAVQMGIKWGTDSKVRFVEPSMGIPMEIGACGEMNLAVSDSRKLLVKLVGTMKGIAWGDNGAGFTKSLQNSFRPLISSAVKSGLPTVIKNENLDIFEIDMHLDKLSQCLRNNISAGFEEYGLTVPQLYVTNVVLPVDDPNFKRMRDLRTIGLQTRMVQAEAMVKSVQADADAEVVAARRKIEMEKQTTETEIAKREAERELIKAQMQADATRLTGFAAADVQRASGLADAEVMRAKGYTQRDVLQADVQKAYAEGIGNIGANGGGGAGSGMLGEFVNLGVGFAAAGAVSGQLNEMIKGFNSPVGSDPAPAAAPAPVAEEAKCAKCGAYLPENAKFCFECGEKVVPPVPDNMIVCPECGNTVVKGKFCPECGHKFITACPDCGTTLPAGVKFCPECGKKL